MKAYKFLNSIHIDRLLRDGTVRVASLDFYRQSENPQWISDRLEGRVEVNIDDITSNDLQEFTPEGFVPILSGGSNNTFKDVWLTYEVNNVFIFCASFGDLQSLTTIMCNNDNGSEPYDACVHIPSIEILAHRMFHRGVVANLQNERVRNIFDYYDYGTVRYENLSRDQTLSRPPAPDPFVKHAAFHTQSEVRIVFYPNSRLLDRNIDILSIKIPKPHNVFLEEFREKPL